MSMNFIVVTGRLGKDAEARFTPGGQKITSFTLARNKKKKDQEVTTWYNVTLWGDQFDNILPMLKKGSLISVVGDLDLRKYKDKQDVEQVSLDVTGWRIEFAPSSQKSGAQEPGAAQPQGGGQPQGGQFQTPYGAQPQAPSPAYASHKPAYGSTASYTQLGGESDEEPLPF